MGCPATTQQLDQNGRVCDLLAGPALQSHVHFQAVSPTSTWMGWLCHLGLVTLQEFALLGVWNQRNEGLVAEGAPQTGEGEGLK